MMVTTAWGAVPPADPCRDTASCQEAAALRDERFAAKVAREPAASRLALTRVAPGVLVDRAAGLVYVVDPDGLAALALDSGAEQWRVPHPGDALSRAGQLLVVTGTGPAAALDVTLVDPGAPADAQHCTLPLPSPPEAEEASAVAFDRRGIPHVWWRSWYSYEGGTPPGEDHLAQQDQASDCGVLELGPDCAARERPRRAFLWDDPARDLGRFPQRCAWTSPLRELPAAAASEPPPDAGAPALQLRALPTTAEGCHVTPALELVVEGPTTWTHRIRDEQPGLCLP